MKAAAARSLPISRPPLAQGIWPTSLALWMAAGYIALFVIRPWEKLFPELAELRFERIYAVAMLGVVAFEGLRVRFTWQTAAVGALLASLGLASAAAVDSSLAWDPFYKYLTLVVFYVVLLSVTRSTYALLFLVTCYLLAMGLYVSKSLWEFHVHGMHHYTMGVVRLIGIDVTFGGPNDMATSILLSLPMVVLVNKARPQFTATWPDFWRRLLPVCLAAYMALAVYALMLTKSRAGMLAFVVYVGLQAIRPPNIGRKIAVALVALVALWFVMPQETRDRFRTVWDPKAGPRSAQESAEGRVAGLKAGLEMFRRSPVLGVGLGNFIPYRLAHLDGVKLEAHNLLGQSLGETGLIGTAAFLAMVGTTLVSGVQLRRRRWPVENSDAHIARLTTLACRDVVLLLLFDGVFGHNLLRFNYLWAAAFTVLSWEMALRAERRARLATDETWTALPRGLALR